MKPKGIFLFVDDDRDEHELLQIAVNKLGYTNEIVSCYNGKEALDFLNSTDKDVFMILCDINMPLMNGIELKQFIENEYHLKARAIPFMFHSNTGNENEIKFAYSLNIQGYFAKAMTVEGTIESLRKIVDFWTDCIHPKNLK
jgi:CheY-like chemotaxis protein